MATYRPHPKQAAAHKAFLSDGYKRGVLFWGRQVGKTSWSVNHAWISAVLRQGQYFAIFKTYTQAHNVIWRQYRQLIPEQLRARELENDLIIELPYVDARINLPGMGWQHVKHDLDQPPSTIRLLGSDQADSHRGLKAHGIIFDEYAEQDPENWDAVYKHFFSTTNGWAAFMSTPKGYNHWYDLVLDAQSAPNWYYSEATWRDNPAITEEFMLNERAEAERKGSLSTFLQETELEFKVVDKAVYPEFSRDVHMIESKDVPEEGTDFITIDFGWAEDHPTAVNFVRVDYHDRWFVYDEIHVTMTPLDDIIEMIRQKATGKTITAMVADSARPDLIDILTTKSLPCPVIPAPKRPNSVQSGIQLMGQKLHPKLQLAGLPRPDFFVTRNCKKTVYQLESYKYKEPQSDRRTSDVPLKKDDDHPDALRYLMLQLKYGNNKQDPIPQPKLSFNEFGLPM